MGVAAAGAAVLVDFGIVEVFPAAGDFLAAGEDFPVGVEGPPVAEELQVVGEGSNISYRARREIMNVLRKFLIGLGLVGLLLLPNCGGGNGNGGY